MCLPTPSAGVRPGQQLGMASPVPGQAASWQSEGKAGGALARTERTCHSLSRWPRVWSLGSRRGEREGLGGSSSLTLDLPFRIRGSQSTTSRLFASGDGPGNLEEWMLAFLESATELGRKGTVKNLGERGAPSLGFLVLFSPKIKMISGRCLQHWV